ncbi:MAG: cysteine desulfurase [Candidatus Pacebacteria bacterium]|nr:cysteine desulfurase [Candidatus Paceibacterota bacterium]
MPKSNRISAKKPNKIYFDYASGVLPNASSIHGGGVKAKIQLENARKSVADILGCRVKEIIFTSGGTESNNLAIQGVVNAAWEQIFLKSSDLHAPISARPFKKLIPAPHIITTNIEHSSVLETFHLLEKRNLAEVSIIPVEKNGIVDPKKIRKAIKKNTVLISVMYANNEIGTIQPIREIAKEIRHFKKLNFVKDSPLQTDLVFHTDAVQAVNYLDLNVERLGVDLLTLSGAKIESAGRAGILYKRSTVALLPIMGGGDQEYGLRPGTENLPAITSFGQALSVVGKNKINENKRLIVLRDYFLKKLSGLDSTIILNGDIKERLPNNINITIPNIPSDLLVIELSAHNIMASAKSACKAGDGKASYVIQAINPNIKDTDGSVRFSLGPSTAKTEIDLTIKALRTILTKLKKWYS